MSADPAKPWIGKNGKVKPAARHKARYFAVQGLYQWQLANSNISDIEAQFRADNDSKRIDWDYFHEILVGISRQRSDLLAELGPYIDRQAEDLDPIEKAILLIATFELKQRIDIPYKVVINEAVELAKTFGATDGHKYVNGVLDKLALKLRAVEVSAK